MQTQQTQKVLIPISADFGYGGFKVGRVTADGIITEVIPSVVGVGVTDMGMLGTNIGLRKTKDKPLSVVFDGVSYLVGRNVRRYATPRERLDLLRLSEGPELRALLYASLWKLVGAGSHRFAMMIGLPVDVVKNSTEAKKVMQGLRGWLIGQHNFSAEGQAVTCEIVSISGTAQPLGSYFAWGSNVNGRWQMSNEARNTPVGILDIGFNTLDLFGVEGGVINKRATGGDTLGMHRVADEIIRQVRETYRVSLSLHEADELMRVYVEGRTPILYHAGQDSDLSAVVELALDEGFNEVNQFIRQYWGRGTRFRYFIITGGGAQAYREKLLEHYPFAVMMSNAVTANAEGLAKLAYRKWGMKKVKQ